MITTKQFFVAVASFVRMQSPKEVGGAMRRQPLLGFIRWRSYSAFTAY